MEEAFTIRNHEAEIPMKALIESFENVCGGHFNIYTFIGAFC
jgi:hypothetical protein